MELSSRVLGPGRASALAVACAISVARALAQESTDSPAAEGEVAAPAPELASTVAPTDASPPAATEPALPELPEIVVVGRRPRGEVERDPTASATVIEADRFAGEAKGVAELVATAPGVAVNEYGGLGHLTTVSIRGATADGVLVLLDGIPLDSALGGGVDLATIPRSWIERIEIVRGAEGAYYGAGALGGVVNVVTRTGVRPSWSVEAGAGSFDTFSFAAEGAGRGAGGTVLANVSAETTGGGFTYRLDRQPDIGGNPTEQMIRTNDAVARMGGVLKGAWTFGPTRLDTAAQASAGRRELPGAVLGLTSEDWQEDARILLSARVSAPATHRLLLALRSSVRADRVDARIGPSLAEQRGLVGGLQAEGRFAHAQGILRAAAEAQGETLRADILAGPRERATLAGSLAEDLPVADGRVRLSSGLRAERVGQFSGISGKAGASVRIAGPLAARASAGRTFRAPSFSELYLKQGLVQPNPELRAEKGLGADAGLVAEHRVGFAALGAHTTLYRDLIFLQPATHGILKPQNSSEALVRGIEAEAVLAPVRALAGLSLSASYTLLDTRILRGLEAEVGNQLPHRARHRLYVRASIAPEPFEVHTELHFVGRQAGDSTGQDPIPATRTWNAGASLRLHRRLAVRLNAEVRNLLDDRTLQDAIGNPLPPRTVLVTLRAGSAPTEGAP